MIRKGLQLTYGHVFLDEFQDTTNLQYRLVKQCFLNSNSTMTAVGDNKQRIMVWAGALKTVFSNFEVDFSAVQRKLIMNHRSAPRLVKLQEMMYLSLKETELSVDASDKWNPDDGTVSLLIADDEENEAQVIANDIIEKISNNILPNELCILCKQLPQNYSSQIIAELGKHQIRARIENEYQDLIKEPIIEMLIALLRLSVDKKRPQDWELIKILSGMMKMVKSKKEFHELLKYILKFWGISRIKALLPTYNQGNYLNDLLTKFYVGRA